MRGDDVHQQELYSYGSLDERVSADHPLRRIRTLADAALNRLSPRFDELYGDTGRPSIAPGKLLRALLLQVLYSVRSERALMDQIDLHIGFRWFVGLTLNEPVWEASSFSKNRERLLGGEIAQEFLHAVLEQARRKHWLSDGRFVVDGTLMEAWASKKSYQPKDDPPAPGAGSGRRGELQKRDLYEVEYVKRLRQCAATPQVTQYTGQRSSAIDRRTTRHPSYAENQFQRRRVERIFAWLKCIGGQRKTRFRGRDRVEWMFQFAAAYNLVRMTKLENSASTA